jgi:hypothetical protein
MNLAETVLLVIVIALPLLLGAGAAMIRRPWWWAAVLAVVLALIAMIAPEPEPGESRLAVGDLPFVLGVCVVVILLVLLGNFIGHRLARSRQAQGGQRT